MSILVPFNGVNYIIPTPGETGWGSNLDSFFVAIGAGCLQKIGGSFLLASEVDFGASFGLKSLYYKAESGVVATSGTVRLASADPGIVFRNNLNSGNLVLTTNASDQLLFNGSPIGGSGIFTASRSIVSDSSGNLAVSATTSTEIGYVSGVTSAIQTQLNLKAPLASPTFTGTVTLPLASATNDLTFASNKGIFWTDNTTNTIKLTAPTSVTTYTLKWPMAQGAANQYLTNDGAGNLSWTNAAGTGTVNTGVQFQLAYYAASTNTVSGLTLITASRALASDTNGLPVASTTTATELGFVSGVTSAIQTQINTKAPSAGPTFTGQVLLASGTMTSPSLAFSSDSSTGIWLNAAGDMRFSSSGGQKFIVGSAGVSVAAGTIAVPAGSAAAPSFTFNSNTADGIYSAGTNLLDFATNGTQAIEIDASQQFHGFGRLNDITFSSNGNTRLSIVNSNSGVNTAVFLSSDNGTSTCNLYKWGTASTNTQLGITTANYGGIIERGAGLVIETTAASPLYFGTNDTLALTIDSSQNVNIPNTKLQTGGHQVYQVVQIITATTTSTTNTSSTSFVTTNLSASITPKFSTSKILVTVSGGSLTAIGSSGSCQLTLQRGASNLLGATGYLDLSASAGGTAGSSSFTYYDSPATTSSTTYAVYAKASTGTNTASFLLSNETASITLIEYAQ